jgi:hypothetical protein
VQRPASASARLGVAHRSEVAHPAAEVLRRLLWLLPREWLTATALRFARFGRFDAASRPHGGRIDRAALTSIIGAIVPAATPRETAAAQLDDVVMQNLFDHLTHDGKVIPLLLA